MSNEPVPSPPIPPVAANVDKTVAIVAYLHLIGLIVAIVINKDERKNALGAFHLRQSLGLILSWIAGCIIFVIPFLGWVAGPIILIGLFVLWIMGIIAAANGKMTPVPVLGASYQKWFGTAFN